MRRVAAAMLCLTLAQCGGSPSGPSGITPPDTFPPGSPSVPVPVVPSLPQVFVGAGDIAMCDANAEATARRVLWVGSATTSTSLPAKWKRAASVISTRA